MPPRPRVGYAIRRITMVGYESRGGGTSRARQLRPAFAQFPDTAGDSGGRQPAKWLFTGRSWLIELPFHVVDALGDEILGDFALDCPGEDGFGGRHRRFGGCRAHVGERLSLGLGDL